MNSMLLGVILGCTSAAIVIPIISKMSLKGEVKTILSIESALGDVFAVVFNADNICSYQFNKFLKLKRDTVMDDTIRFFYSEVTFFVRTFFFVYIGIVLVARYFSVTIKCSP